MNLSKSELKELIRETTAATLHEHENRLHDVITDAVLNMKPAGAIEEGDTGEYVPQAEIINRLVVHPAAG